jgi:hypothetical protein
MAMTRLWLWTAVALAIASVAHAEEIHKCTGPDGIVYQNLPCAAGQREQDMDAMTSIQRAASSRDTDASAPQGQGPRASSPALYSNRRDRTAARPPQSGRYAGTPFAATTLFIGMTDTQVLNLPGWGRPARISRSKDSQGWREQWVYRNSSDQSSLLYFQNGRLVEREDAPLPTLEARASTEN